MASKFVHLHVHSEFSLLDGLSKISSLLKKAKEYDSPALAITDHGAMYGAIEFYKKAVTEALKPIIGCEIYMSASDYRERKRKDAFHLTVLARDLQGYQNLMKIVTISQTEGFYYKPRVDMDVLAKYSAGLIATSGCPAGLISRQLVNESYQAAKKTTQQLAQIFGSDNFYIEIQRHDHQFFSEQPGVPEATQKELLETAKEMKQLEKSWLQLSRDLGLPIIATNDVHYVNKEDAVAQDAIVCIQTGKNISDIDRLRYIDVPDYYLKSPDEMSEVFIDLPEAIQNTVKIADQVDIQITLGQWFFPKFDLPKDQTPGDALREKALQGAKKLYPDFETNKILQDRLNFELEVIDSKGYSPYFLIFADMTDFARQNDIYVNTRGSAAGSIVSYSCGITIVDPIKYQLPFERFLNPLRPSPPDIDLDISDNRRDDMISYLKDKYQAGRVAQICTFGTMAARGSVRDVGRVLGMPYAGPDRISKLIPMGKQGFPMTLKKALESTPQLKDAYNKEEPTKILLDLARKIEGNVRHLSVHAAGVVVAPSELTDFTPLQKEPGQGDKIITQYEMHACEDVGLIKMDILGIRNLSIMADAIKIIKKLRATKIDIYNVPLNDQKTFQMLGKGETFGVFQMASAGMTRYITELQPTRVEDLMIMVALYRPGPLANIPEFISRKKGLKPIEYYHPKMEKFLAPSFGVLVYQDDLLSTALELAGYNWETVDKFRRAVGKKIPEEMARQHEIFVDGCQEHSSMTKEEAEGLWKLFEPFQGYGFNKAHAASYGMVSYWTAYLKANYPVEYMCALLTAEAAHTDKLVEAIAECERMGIRILPPDINESLSGFTIVDGGIRFGLSAIKNLGEAAITSILSVRKKAPFSSLTDFLVRTDAQKCNKKVLESLVKVGALDRFGKRTSVFTSLEILRSKITNWQKKKTDAQQSLFDDGATASFDTQDYLPEVEDWDIKDKLKYEKELLGFYLSANPLKDLLLTAEKHISHRINQLDITHHLGQTVTIAGTISRSKQVFTKKNNSAMAFVTIQDDTGAVDVVVFPSIYEKHKELCQPESSILLKGKVDSREGQINIIADEITAIDSLPQVISSESELIKEITIPRGTAKEILTQVSSLLKQHSGSDKLVILIPNHEQPRRVPVPYGVNFTPDLQQQINLLLTDVR